jgi:hypothetical protein
LTGASIDPVLPSHVAVILTVPTATPVTTPVALTVAMAGALVDQVTVRPVSRVPVELRTVAISC